MAPKAESKTKKMKAIKIDTQGPTVVTPKDIRKNATFKMMSEENLTTNKHTSDQQLLESFEEMEKEWGLDIGASSDFSSNVTRMLQNFRVLPGASLEDVQDKTKRVFYRARLIFDQLKLRGILKMDNDVKNRINRLLDCISNAGKCVFLMARYGEVQNPRFIINVVDPLAFEDPDAKIPKYTRLCSYLISEACRLGYRQFGGECYCQIVMDGEPTHAWKKALAPTPDDKSSSLDRFVQSCTDELYNNREHLWKQAAAGNAGHAAKYLQTCGDARFPILEKDRHVFAFTNGLYIAKNYSDETKKYNDLFVEYSCKTIPDDLVACKFFDQPFNNFEHLEDWYEIPTPFLQCIFDYQELEKDVCIWIYVLLGRMLYDVGELDGWQVIAFFKGLAKSGKSTLLNNVIALFYEFEDVGNLSNNAQKEFGISAFKDKLLYIAPEIKSDLKLSQAEFQSMCSGEGMCINIKHKTGETINSWKAPGALAGNELPGFADTSGSVVRRAIMIEFTKKVVDGDMKLKDKLALEISAIMKKCNLAYLEAVNNYGDKDIWTVLPKYFLDTQAEFQQGVHSLEGFLASGKVEFGKAMFCPFDTFRGVFNEYCRSENKDKQTLNLDTYRGAFQKYELMVVNDTRKYPRNSEHTTTRKTRYITGVDIFTEEVEEVQACKM